MYLKRKIAVLVAEAQIKDITPGERVLAGVAISKVAIVIARL